VYGVTGQGQELSAACSVLPCAIFHVR